MSVSCEMDRGTNSKLRGKIVLGLWRSFQLPAGCLKLLTSLRMRLEISHQPLITDSKYKTYQCVDDDFSTAFSGES